LRACRYPLLLAYFTVALHGCGGSSSALSSMDGGTREATVAADSGADVGADAQRIIDAQTDDEGDGAVVIGSPCAPTAEVQPSFDGFQKEDVELMPVPSGSPTCLIDHFQGLVTCPYGQSASGQPPADASACTTTDGQPVTGMVLPQCMDRTASHVVVWSCRCANFEGQTDDGAQYCTCPSTTTCAQLVSSLGGEDEISGGYCIPPAALFPDGGINAICSAVCDPTTHPCE